MNAQGRPNELKKGKPTLFYIEENDLQAFKALSVKQGKSMSELVRVFVKDYLKKHQNNAQPSLEPFSDDPKFKAFPTIAVSPEGTDPEPFSDDELYEMATGGASWRKWALHQMEKRNAGRKVHHKKIQKNDIEWHMNSKNFSKEQAIAYLKQQGFEE